MGILDEAIREHLELKRSHGADESELDGLQAEAFGPADRPEAVEAETKVISPGSSLTSPAGEGDQLDKVFDATRAAEESAEGGDTGDSKSEAPASPEATGEDATVAEHAIPAPAEAAGGEAELSPDDAIHEADTAEAGPPEPTKPPAPAADQNFDDVEGGDAGDALQRERMSLSGHPTEHYDVDAAIAEEDEIDILSESSLSDELDRALDGPDAAPASDAGAATPTPAPAEPAEPAKPSEPEADEPESPDEPVSDEFDSVFEDVDEAKDADEAEEAEEVESEVVTEEPDEEEAEAETEAEAEPVKGDPDFFDQDDPLEATPDFLEETPEHDRLWFEQKPPKDFEFGD